MLFVTVGRIIHQQYNNYCETRTPCLLLLLFICYYYYFYYVSREKYYSVCSCHRSAEFKIVFGIFQFHLKFTLPHATSYEYTHYTKSPKYDIIFALLL